ncbi:vWA domain-containing protein [Streptomyces sp. CA-111067]|uniref:vWA domain-containing protein n=1 Tax=Streptomyces sp. CA-111067 TaxID=3240046 RepID=UPI003D956BA0
MKHTVRPRALRGVRDFAAVLGAALLAVPALAAGPAQAAPADTAHPTRAEIYQALELGQEPADYAILVDTSGSMKQNGRYDTVRATLRPFLDGLTPQDHVELVTFDSSPHIQYIGSAGDTDAIMSHLPAQPNPHGATDIGAALDKALTELERDDASPVASIVLLTDGEQDPAPGSRYPTSSGPSWTALQHRADAIGDHAQLAGYALPLGSGASGADLLGHVVSDTTELRPKNIQDLGGYLARAGDRTRARQAALLLAGDKGKGLDASWSNGGRTDLTDGTATARLTLRSTTSRVPLTVTGLRASVTDPSIAVGGLPGQVTLQPGKSKTYTVRLTGKLPAGPIPYRRTENKDAVLRLAGRVGSAWEQPLAPDVKLSVPRQIQVTGPAVPLRATVGSAVLLPAVLGGLVLVLLAGWLLWRRSRRPLLTGALLVARALGDQEPERIALRGRHLRLRPETVGGAGRVRGRRRSTDRVASVDLLIRYSPDGSSGRESTATCVPGGHVVINGVRFQHQPAPVAGRVPVGGRSR